MKMSNRQTDEWNLENEQKVKPKTTARTIRKELAMRPGVGCKSSKIHLNH